ncbi:MAG TPA: sigma-70 family RNA polymerase sigma factor [Ignavibacteria bacterium]|nr:sigma-70 family RNA polymerase sigma factor [Ignavibacteria bacterium]
MMTKIDNEILSRISKGENSLFSEIVNEFKDKAFSLAFRILKNAQDAEDSLQEAFIRLYNALKNNSYKAESKFSTYVYSIVYNTAVEFYRKINSKSFSVISIDITEARYTDGDELLRNYQDINERQEISEIIKRYINNIPQQYSVILTMYFINELTLKEIADMLEMPVGTVKNRIFRAKEKLRELLLRDYSAEELKLYA